ncbi:MAG: amino acid-binding protein [Fidelibacterota bacterium]
MAVTRQFSVFLENAPGHLAKLTRSIADAGVNLLAISIPPSAEHGIIRIVTEDPDATRSVLSETGHAFSETDVLLIELENKVGALAEAAEKLAAERINVEYAYCSVSKGGTGTAAIFKVSDLEKASAIL